MKPVLSSEILIIWLEEILQLVPHSGNGLFGCSIFEIRIYFLFGARILRYDFVK
jgi:hypothetical protein